MKIIVEKCIICNKSLNVRKDTHIHLRDYYIEGVGQTCPSCYRKLMKH